MFVEDIKDQVITISSAGNNTILAAPTDGAHYEIDHINIVPNSAVTMTIYSGATAKSGTYSLTSNQGFVLENPSYFNGIVKCGTNEAFILNLGGAVQVSGFIKYRICGR